MNNYIDYDIIIPENIKKIKRHRYFDKLNKINKLLYTNTIECMQTSMIYCKYKEVLILIDYFNTKKLINYGSYNNVDITKEMNSVLQDMHNVNFIAIHNHPTDNNFSLQDIKTFLSKRNINLMIVVTNTCKYQAALYKTKTLNRNELLRLKFELNKVDRNSFNIYNIINTLYKCGIQYKEFKNY